MTAPLGQPSDTTAATTTQSRSRRALLAGALGGLGAWAAAAIGRASPVRAEGETMVVGGEYPSATSRTLLQNSTNSATVFEAGSTSGIGVWGHSDTYWGVNGVSGSSAGVRGISTSDNGVYGYSDATQEAAVLAESWGNSTGLLAHSGTTTPGAKPKTGVYGYANQDATSKGVWGFSGRGAGIYGQANRSGFALRGNGRLKLDKVSGVASIAAGTTSVTVSPGVNVTPSSFVLLTPKANLGGRDLWFSTNATADTFTIRISSSRSSATQIAWLLLG